nr:hypothetical protein Iba_chr14dCG15120 [Ipomoea batatas]
MENILFPAPCDNDRRYSTFFASAKGLGGCRFLLRRFNYHFSYSKSDTGNRWILEINVIQNLGFEVECFNAVTITPHHIAAHYKNWRK